MAATDIKPIETGSSIADVGKQVGNTPLRFFQSISRPNVPIYAKAEWNQLGGSIKARAAFNIIRTALEDGDLSNGGYLLDASSGNTAIAYGAIGQKLGINVTICLPENASSRRIEQLRDLGVEIVFTSPFEGTEGAQDKAKELVASHPGKYFYADQYSNDANWLAHVTSTGPEIIRQTNGLITHFVAGLGTTGTFTGTSRYLRSYGDIELTALQPDGPLHILEGWKHLETAYVPAIYDDKVADQVLPVSSEETVDMMQLIYREEGIKLSPSSAANLVGASKVANELSEGVVVTVLPDSIDRYKEVEQEVFGK